MPSKSRTSLLTDKFIFQNSLFIILTVYPKAEIRSFVAHINILDEQPFLTACVVSRLDLGNQQFTIRQHRGEYFHTEPAFVNRLGHQLFGLVQVQNLSSKSKGLDQSRTLK